MKTTLLALLTLGVLITGCNEKVSPDLGKTSSVSTTGDSTPPTTFVFEVTNTAPAMLDYKLHRTGALDASGNLKDCKISTTTAFNNANFIADNARPDHDDKVYDISCFYEAEEEHMWHSGIDFTVNASKNTCEYVAYAPFSFFQYQPGNSSGSLTTVSAEGAATCTTSGILDKTGSAILCGYTVDNDIAAGTRTSFLESDDTVCAYDYTASGGPNCDIGVITIKPITCTVNTVTGVSSCAAGAPKTINCGGKVSNCIQGPIKKVTQLSGATRGSIAYQTVQGDSFSQQFSLDGGDKEGFTNNNHLVNFRRDLANPNIDFTNHLAGYAGRFRSVGNTAYLSKYDPRLMDRYSNNKLWDGVTNAYTALNYNTVYSVQGTNERIRKPLAADPFMGVSGYRSNPFYIFYCFDGALDVKARIRMVVRDWDRVHPTTNSSFNLITDITDSANDSARQDNSYNEIGGDNDGYSGFNDIPDWDDLYFMTRSGAALVDATTLWEPSLNFFNANLFPGSTMERE